MTSNTEWQQTKLRPDALAMLNELAYDLTGKLRRRIALSDAVRIACRHLDLDMLIDPDCRDGKHGSCMGGNCECSHHTAEPSSGEAANAAR